MTTNNWHYRQIHKFSQPQQYDMFPCKYRIKNYIAKKWEYIHRIDKRWRFRTEYFLTMTDLRIWLDQENKLWKKKIEMRNNEK